MTLSKSRIWVFTDLDDTLFQTERKLPAGIPAKVAALDKEREPSSFSTPQQWTLLNTLHSGGATVIPVTGRNHAAFDRHVLGEDIFGELRILSHGAVIMNSSGKMHSPWMDYLIQNFNLDDWARRLEEFNQIVVNQIEATRLPLRTRVISEQGISAYVSIKSNETEQSEGYLSSLLKQLQKSCEMSSWGIRLHTNGNNMALMAPYTCKAQAVRYAMDYMGIDSQDLVLGMGDSLTDLPFLREAHFGLFPIGSQIDKRMH